MFKERVELLAKYAEGKFDPDFMNDLREPKDYYNTKIRVRTSRGKELFRVMGVLHCNPHSTGASPYKGGLRYHPSVSIDLLSALALDMTEKCALAELPFGGAKFGIPINPSEYSEEELQEITEAAAYKMLLDGKLDPDVYVPGPDVGTNSDTMLWIYNKAAEMNPKIRLPNVPAVVTGKPIEFNGCPGREDATARGLLILLKEYLRLASRCEYRTMAIQGFGNVGMNLAKLTLEPEFSDFKVVALSDINGGIHNSSEPLDVAGVLSYYEEHKTFAGFNGDLFSLGSARSLLTVPCDILIPAAMENQIAAGTVRGLNAKMVAEAANEAVSIEAQEYLESQQIPFLPGIAANAGGVTVSYIEWSRNRGPRRHNVNIAEDLERVREDLRKIMTGIIRQMYDNWREGEGSLAECAHIIALEKIYHRWRMKHGGKRRRP